MAILLHHKTNIIDAEISLPSSKSISNRLLIINALSSGKMKLYNLSDSDDTDVFKKNLSSDSCNINVNNCGSAMRFLTAYFSIQNKEVYIKGNTQMGNRPIGALVDALNQIGADISYIKKKGFPPLQIRKGNIVGKEVILDSSFSSQFISALLLVAPTLREGLHIYLKGDLVSEPYVHLTLDIMKKFGVGYSWKDNYIHVFPSRYKTRDYICESDWSSASFWYEIVALSNQGEVLLRGLKKDSSQGDSFIKEIYKDLGVVTTFNKDGCLIKKQGKVLDKIKLNLEKYPDLAQPISCTCAGLNISLELSGLKTLNIKETNRLIALKAELEKMNKEVNITDSTISFSNGKNISNDLIIDSHNDHRMAMSFAPLSLKLDSITIKNPEVVSKSYSNFWNDLDIAGFQSTKY